MTTKVCCISDTHTYHHALDIPVCDLVIHAGDFSSTGLYSEVEDFMIWFNEVPAKYKICIAGNHERTYEEPFFRNHIVNMFPDIIYLHSEGIEIEGLNIYGECHSPEFMNWAFNLPRGGPELKAKWDAVPNNTDILISHTMPKNILDFVPYTNSNEGCELLAERVKQLPNLKLFVGGHLHYENHQLIVQNDVIYVNASVVNEQYQVVGNPILLEI
jgi:hypothetical protein